MTEYWKAFAKDVLWKTIKKAFGYSIVGGFACVILAFIVLATWIPTNHSTSRKFLEGVFMVAVFAMAGFGCGFLFGICTLHSHVERIADAVYQTVRGMVGDSAARIGGSAQSISTEQLRRLMDSDAGAWLTKFSTNFGAAKRLYQWVVRRPVQLLQKSIVSEFLPKITEANISMNTVEEFIRNHLVQVVKLPLEAKLKTVQYAAVLIGCIALAIPLILMRLV